MAVFVGLQGQGIDLLTFFSGEKGYLMWRTNGVYEYDIDFALQRIRPSLASVITSRN